LSLKRLENEVQSISWKKVGVYILVLLGVFLLGAGATAYICGKDVLDQRERVKLLNRQYQEAVEAERAARTEATGLNDELFKATGTIGELRTREAGLICTIAELRRTDEVYKRTIDGLRQSIKVFLDSFDEFTGAIGESGSILQDSLRLLSAIAERNGGLSKEGEGK